MVSAYRLSLFVSAMCFLSISCSREPGHVVFTDVTAAAGIDFAHENGARGKRRLPETTVGGAGWIDYDGDGLFDLYLVNANLHSDRGGQGETSSKLYRNLGSGKFEDVTESSGAADHGFGAGLAVGDYDNDGRSDLYVTHVGPNVLFHNEGGKFRDATAAAGVAGGGWSSSAAFFDYDSDGDLDLYVCRYLEYDPEHACQQAGLPVYCSPHDFPGVPDTLYRNRGDGTFEDVSRAAGIAIAGPSEGKSLGVVILDADDDGDPDIFVACDQVPNLFFRNNGNGTFTEAGLVANLAYGDDGQTRAGMGVDAGDVDLDGSIDIVVTNFADEPTSLFRRLSPGFFSDESKRFDIAGLTLTRLGFGVVFIDYDLDSDLDLYIANGHVLDNIKALRPGMTFAQPDQLLENDGGRRFVDVSSSSGEWFSRATVSRSAASCDFDNDGDEDIVILSSGSKAVLLRNDGPHGHWIAFQLQGTRSNRDGYGAKVTVHARRGAESFTRVFEAKSARSYASACDPRVRAGLGAGPVIVEKVEIRWPSGTKQVIEAPAIDRAHKVVEPAAAGAGR